MERHARRRPPAPLSTAGEGRVRGYRRGAPGAPVEEGLQVRTSFLLAALAGHVGSGSAGDAGHIDLSSALWATPGRGFLLQIVFDPGLEGCTESAPVDEVNKCSAYAQFLGDLALAEPTLGQKPLDFQHRLQREHGVDSFIAG
jgi:hypothetical protein